MKNIHLIKTDKPSKLGYIFDNLILNSKLLSPTLYKNQNIYITSNEGIKDGDWCFGMDGIFQYKGKVNLPDVELPKKIILTTDQDLIKDGVQAIDDEFLQWFVTNQSCESVEIQYRYNFYAGQDLTHYKIIIPKEEPKQYPISGYAPGFYSCTCVTCEEKFQGHKRATQCEPCAIKMTQEESKNTCPKCRTKDFDTCHSIKCPMRKEEPKQEIDMMFKYIIGIDPCEKEEPKTNLDRLPFPELIKEFAEYYKNVPLVEEPKQETIEEASKNYANYNEQINKAVQEAVKFGAKWQQEQNKNKFSDEEVLEFANWCRIQDNKHSNRVITTQQLFEQFKKQRDEQ
jgi:hypothetical protein